MENRNFDVLIIGGGPGGYTAALYAARAGLRTGVLEQLAAGGQMAQTHQIDNYPGFPQGVEGFWLAQKMQAQAERFGAVTLYTQVNQAELTAEPKAVQTGKGSFYGKTVVIATGAGPMELGLEGEQALTGRGVAYCAACDGMFYRDKTVAVVGGGNSAAGEALLLSRIAKRVILIHRRDTLRAEQVCEKLLKEAPNVEFCWNSRVIALLGKERLRGVCLENVGTGDRTELSVEGLFVSIGRKPMTELFRGQVELDEKGYIQAGETTQTNIAGVYAVGDVRTKPMRQIVTALSDGAVAAHMAQEYIQKMLSSF